MSLITSELLKNGTNFPALSEVWEHLPVMENVWYYLPYHFRYLLYLRHFLARSSSWYRRYKVFGGIPLSFHLFLGPLILVRIVSIVILFKKIDIYGICDILETQNIVDRPL